MLIIKEISKETNVNDNTQVPKLNFAGGTKIRDVPSTHS
jgi:hypothetical protein